MIINEMHLDYHLNSLKNSSKGSFKENKPLIKEFIQQLAENYSVKKSFILTFDYRLTKIIDISSNIDEKIDEGLLILRGSRNRPQRFTLNFFKRKGYKCYICGKKAVRTVTWKNDRGDIITTLLTKDGVTMTKDHVVPKSKGGNNLNNLEPCCLECNIKKGDILRRENE